MTQALNAQNRKYFERLDAALPVEVTSAQANENKLDVLAFDQQNYDEILIDFVNAIRKRKSQKDFGLDTMLNRFSHFAVQNFPKSFFTKRKYAKKVVRYTDLSLRRMGMENRVFEARCFYVDLMEMKGTGNFYFKRLDQTTELRLFLGDRPRISNPDHPDYVEPIPMSPLSETGFCKSFFKCLKRELGMRNLLNRSFTQLSIGVRVDPTSLNRKKIPRAFVYVIVVGKQMQKIKRKRAPSSIPQNNTDPYIILK